MLDHHNVNFNFRFLNYMVFKLRIFRTESVKSVVVLKQFDNA